MPTDHGSPRGFDPPRYRSPPASMAKSRNGSSSRAAVSTARPFATAPRSSVKGRRSVMVLSIRIEQDIAVADIVIGRACALHDRSGAMFPVEAARLHPMADGRIERAAGLLRHHQREPHGFVEDRARRHRRAGLRRELHQFAALVEPRAARFDLVKPSERAIHRRLYLAAGADHVDGHERAHRDLGADRQESFPRRLTSPCSKASTTAP